MPRSKTASLGVCDLCAGPILRSEWYTSKGRPRLHCSIVCRQTDNSRTGAPIRAEKAKGRVRQGTWINPRALMTDDEISQTQSRAARTARAREVQDGRWRNPALSDKARKKLSKPRQHKGALASAIEKVRQVGMASLNAKERTAYLAYRKRLRAKRRDEIRQYYRDRYKAQQAKLTPEEREGQRAKWREQNHKRRNG